MRSSLRLKSNDPTGNFRIKRIAWAFLLPVGGGESKDDPEHCNVGLLPDWTKQSSSLSSKVHIRRKMTEDESSAIVASHESDAQGVQDNYDIQVVLQLYAYTADGLFEGMQRKSLGWPEFSWNLSEKDDPAFPHSIPEVYLQWRRRHLAELPTALKVSLGPAPLVVELEAVPNLHLKEPDEEGKPPAGSSAPPNSAARKKHQYVRKLTKEMRLEISRRSRTDAESCRIPDMLLHKLDVGPFGAMSLAFSHCGIFLAVSGESALSRTDWSSSFEKNELKGTLKNRFYDEI